jgi:hypothetical protein
MPVSIPKFGKKKHSPYFVAHEFWLKMSELKLSQNQS